MHLVEDGTYYVHEHAGEIVACGGWSKRHKLASGEGDAAGDDRLLDPRTDPARVRMMFVRSDWTRRGLGRAILESCERAAREAGFTRLVLGATLPGEPLYRAFGFREDASASRSSTPDGVALAGRARWSARSRGACRMTRLRGTPLAGGGSDLGELLVDLRQAEGVAGRVAEAGVDAVRALLGRLGELDAAGRELLVGGLAVVGRRGRPCRRSPSP